MIHQIQIKVLRPGQPLETQPLLAAEVEAPQADAQRGLLTQVLDAQGRQITLQSNDELHAALSRLIKQALAASDWGLPLPVAPAPDPALPVLS